jgi:hypothetical protein
MTTTTELGVRTAGGRRRYPLLAILLLFLSLTFAVGVQLVLGPVFGYPGIAEAPAAETFEAFDANRTTVSAIFYVVVVAELMRIPIAIGLHQMLRGGAGWLLTFTVFGALAGVFRALDYILWPFLVPRLADAYLDPASSDATRDAAAVMYDSLFSYLGDALGGNLGLLLIIVWVLGISAAMLGSGRFPRWLVVWGVLGALGTAVNYAEFLGSTTGVIGAVGAVGQALVYTWIAATGVVLLVGVREHARPKGQDTPAPARA